MNLIFKNRFFENLACEILAEFDKNSEEINSAVLILQKNFKYFNDDCFELAIQGDDVCMKFISSPYVNNVILKLWRGNWSPSYNFYENCKIFLSILSFGLLAPFIVFKNNSEVNYLLYL
jgi:hypothetical protein